MSVSQEIRDYFSKLIELLPKDAGLTGSFERMKGEILEQFKTNFEE